MKTGRIRYAQKTTFAATACSTIWKRRSVAWRLVGLPRHRKLGVTERKIIHFGLQKKKNVKVAETDDTDPARQALQAYKYTILVGIDAIWGGLSVLSTSSFEISTTNFFIFIYIFLAITISIKIVDLSYYEGCKVK